MTQVAKKLTLKDVAKQLGVSTATVSNAFNRPDQLSTKLREHILKEAAALGYHGANFAARSLRRGESGVVGVLLADSLSYSFSDPVANQLMQGIAEVLVEQHKQMLLLSLNEVSSDANTEQLPDGFIIYGRPKAEAFERIVRTGKPFVTVDFTPRKGHYPGLLGSVNIDNQHGAKISAEHLYAQGADNLAVLGLRLIESDRVCRLTDDDLLKESEEISRARLTGYQQAAHIAGKMIPADKVWHIPVNNPHMAERAAREALTLSPLPDGLLCMSDVIALAAIRVARSLNITVPEQVKIVGFDDIPEASRSEPSLTSVCQQCLEKGRLAASMLLTDNVTDGEQMQTRLVVRQSSLPV